MTHRTVIGLTGGVGSGKSQVLDFLAQEYGAHVIIADQVARRLMESGQPGYIQVVKALGTGFLKEDGSIDRPQLSRLIFSDSKALETVNSITHPMAWEAIRNMILESESELVIVEAALLQKEKDDIYDELWYLYTSRENRMERLIAGRGYTRQQCLSIMAGQPSDEEFRAHCQRVIDNNGTLEETKTQIRAILGKLSSPVSIRDGIGEG